jgi:hypothetical protein
MPASVYDRLGQGGFRYLYENGVVYENAHHRHANTETVVGHATLATGADPADHGMIGNIWFDKELGRTVYNIEDDRYTLVGEGGGVDKDVEMDPTQKAAGTDGRSPSTILSTTFSDELALSTNGKAKIFGVSVKDRGAVTMAGHAGKAFWFSKAKGEFVTSTYYYDAYPGWVIAWNRKKLPLAYADTHWELLHARSTYTYGDHDDMPWETDFPGYGVVFPHPFGKAEALISGFNHPYVYLNNEILRERELDADEVSRAIAAELAKFNGVAYAVPSIDLIEGKMPDTRLYRQILRNFNLKRSGDIYLVLEPQWFVNEFDGLTVASTHGSPWRYDTFVPVIFAGNGLAAKTVFREVQTVDIALTLAKYLRIKAPSGATGAPLTEVLGQ